VIVIFVVEYIINILTEIIYYEVTAYNPS